MYYMQRNPVLLQRDKDDIYAFAPNTFVNCDIPSHSVVFGNPCIIKYRDNATENYINRKCTFNS